MSSHVLVGITGGARSKRAAETLLDDGFAVTGATVVAGCAPAWDEVVAQAAYICDELGIRHIVIDGEKEFENRVVAPAVRALAKGLEPDLQAGFISEVLFALLAQTARENACEHIATGHVATLEALEAADKTEAERAGLKQLADTQALADEGVLLDKQCRPIASSAGHAPAHRAQVGLFACADDRDESALLAGVPIEILERTILPLAPAMADASPARNLAIGEILPTAQELLSRLDVLDGPGNIVDKAGNVIGRHAGVCAYRLKQQVAIESAPVAEPLYVIRKDVPNKRLVVGAKQQAQMKECLVTDVNWLIETPSGQLRVVAKLSTIPQGVRATLEVMGGMAMLCGSVGALTRLLFDSPQLDVVAGQRVAFCDEGGRVLASGSIQ